MGRSAGYVDVAGAWSSQAEVPETSSGVCNSVKTGQGTFIKTLPRGRPVVAEPAEQTPGVGCPGLPLRDPKGTSMSRIPFFLLLVPLHAPTWS